MVRRPRPTRPIGRMEGKPYRILWVLMFISVIEHNIKGIGASQDVQLAGLDCRKPSRIRTSLLQDVCETGISGPPDKVMPVLILQYEESRVVEGFRCEKKESTFQFFCGAYSHSKNLPPEIGVAVPIDPTTCKRMVDNQEYVQEDKSVVKIKYNAPYMYQYVRKGKIIRARHNVYCEGTTIRIDGRTQNGMVEMVSTEVIVRKISIELGRERTLDLDRNVQMPEYCSKQPTCVLGPVSYVLREQRETCPLYTIRSLLMTKTRLKVGQKERTAYINNEHKILLTAVEKETAPVGCRVGHYLRTEHDKLKIIPEDLQQGSVKHLAQFIPASALDVDLELKVTAEYLAYNFERAMAERINLVGKKLCEMAKEGLHNQELSPFHPNSMLRIKGDLVQELQCEPVNAKVKLGEKRGNHCTRDTLPVWVNGEPVFIRAGTRQILPEEEINRVPCNGHYPPMFVLEDNKTLAFADPVVTLTNVPLTHQKESMLHLNEISPVEHPEYDSDILYSADEIQKWNQLIHFGRTKSVLLEAISSHYCYNNAACGGFRPKEKTSVFNLDDLKPKKNGLWVAIWKVDRILTKVGSYCSLAHLLLMICTIILKVWNIYKLTCRRKIPAKEAFLLSFFLDNRMRESILRHTKAKKRPVVEEVDEDESEPGGFKEQMGRVPSRILRATPRLTYSASKNDDDMLPLQEETSTMKRPTPRILYKKKKEDEDSQPQEDTLEITKSPGPYWE